MAMTAEEKYSAVIKKIQRRRKWVMALTLIATLSILIFCTPVHFEVMEETVIESKGLHPVLLVLLILLCFWIEIIAYALVSTPLTTSMDRECDPEKQLVLNMLLNKQKNKDSIYACDYFYLGVYAKAIEYAENMIKNPKEQYILVGLYQKARCEFFLGDYEAFRQTALLFESKLLGAKKIKPKLMAAYEKMNMTLHVMGAISEDNVEIIQKTRNLIEPWNMSKATEGFVYYLKGLCAYKLDDKEEAIYRFKFVADNCFKTVLATLSNEYLSSLK